MLRRGRHAELVGRLEVFQDFPPVTIVAGAAAVALVDHDQVEEVRRELAVQPRPALVLGQRRVDGEVHFAAVAQRPFADLDAGVAEGGEGLVLGIIHQHVAVGQVEDLGPAVLARAIPQRRPELPTGLDGHERLARARGHAEQHPPVSRQDGMDGTIDGDFLVVPRVLAGEVVGGRQQPLGGLGGEMLGARQPAPQLVGRGEGVKLPLPPGQAIELDDTLAVGGVGEFEVQDFGVFLRLLEPLAGGLVARLGLNDGDGEVRAEAEDVVGPPR
jgi:hypothetical protein